MLTGPSSCDARLAPARDLLGVALGVGGGEAAAGIAGAGDEAGADRASPWSRARAPRCAASASVDACRSGTPEISRFCQTVRRMSPSPSSLRDRGEPAHLRRGQLADRQHDADPVQAVLLLRDARRYGRCGRTPGAARSPRPARARACAPSFSSTSGEEFLEAPGVEHVFQPRLVAVGAVAVLDEDAHDGVGDLGRVLRLHDHAGVAREILVAGDAAEREPEPDARLDAEAVLHLDRLEADVVGVLQHRRCMPAPSKATLNLRGRP